MDSTPDEHLDYFHFFPKEATLPETFLFSRPDFHRCKSFLRIYSWQWKICVVEYAHVELFWVISDSSPMWYSRIYSN